MMFVVESESALPSGAYTSFMRRVDDVERHEEAIGAVFVALGKRAENFYGVKVRARIVNDPGSERVFVVDPVRVKNHPVSESVIEVLE